MKQTVLELSDKAIHSLLQYGEVIIHDQNHHQWIIKRSHRAEIKIKDLRDLQDSRDSRDSDRSVDIAWEKGG